MPLPKKESVVFLFRRFPVGLLLIGWLLLSIGRGAGSGASVGAIGALLFLPFLLFKVMFLFLIFRVVMGTFGAGPRHVHRRRRRPETAVPERDPEWEQNLEEARSEIDEMFPDEA